MSKVKASLNKAKDVIGVQMELSIKDRLMLLALLPKESNIITLTLAKDIKEKVDLTQADIKKYEIKPVNGGAGLTWQEPKQGKEVIFSSAEMELLKSQVESLDRDKKVTPELLPLCLKIREYPKEKDNG